jgi:septum formation protein
MLILASLSPRRRELLGLITPDFITVDPAVEESLPADTSPRDAVRLLALRKAAQVARDYPEDTVIGADTVVVLGDRLLGKPQDAVDAVAMLSALSGRGHRVYTGVAIVRGKEEIVFDEVTTVHFRELTAEEIAAYVASGEPLDKAGAYGIQGRAALFISGIVGDYYNVMGLPVCALAQKMHSSQFIVHSS